MVRPVNIPEFSAAFTDLMAEYQPRLSAYIRSLVGEEHASKDILQETNVMLLRKSRDFELGTNFLAWAFRVAHFEVLKWRRGQGRERLHFDDALVAALAHTAEESTLDYDDRLKALETCLSQLPERQREVIERRYLRAESVTDISADLGFKANAASQLLFRARASLLKCMMKLIPA